MATTAKVSFVVYYDQYLRSRDYVIKTCTFSQAIAEHINTQNYIDFISHFTERKTRNFVLKNYPKIIIPTIQFVKNRRWSDE
jgi:hypothetical protein